MNIDLEKIRSLLDVVSSTDITELTIESGEEKITIKKQVQAVLNSTTVELPLAQTINASPPQRAVEPVHSEPAAKKPPEEDNSHLIPITSPMVGTFYRSSSPNSPPFVDIGDLVSPGQTVCIIEAMKLMNDLPAEVSGRIVKCCVENGTTVEYGQPLFMVNPKA